MSAIVVDLGSERHGRDYSVEPLVKRFSPDTLFGFDPATAPCQYEVEQTAVVVEQSAAWIHDGDVLFSATSPIEGTVMVDSSVWNGDKRAVRCFDFSAWLSRLASPAVVKMDIEGAEVPVLEKVIADGNDDRISLLLLEWHDSCFDDSFTVRRAAVEQRLRCPVEIWH